MTILKIAQSIRAHSLIAIVVGVTSFPFDFALALPMSDECLISSARLPSSAPRASTFKPGAPLKKKARLKLKSKLARGFRTVIREGYSSEPNFNGHDRIVIWGCGAACLSWVVTDQSTGDVYEDKDFSTVLGDHVETERLEFSVDSRLIKLAGTPNEDSKREGFYFIEFKNHRFHIVKQYGRAIFCQH